MLDNMYMNLSLFLKEHSKKIKTASIIVISALSVIGLTVGLTLTILNKDKGITLKPHEVRHNFSLENLRKNNKKFSFQGTVENKEFEFNSFTVSINIEDDNLYYFKQLDDTKFEIKNDNGVLTDVYKNIELGELSLKKYIYSSYYKLTSDFYFYPRCYDISNAGLVVEDNKFVYHSKDNDDYLICDFDGFMLEETVIGEFSYKRL